MNAEDIVARRALHLHFDAAKEEYAELEEKTLGIVYPEGEELPLVALGAYRRVYQNRREERNAVLRDALKSRRFRLAQLG